jgi:hypothetical protein
MKGSMHNIRSINLPCLPVLARIVQLKLFVSFSSLLPFRFFSFLFFSLGTASGKCEVSDPRCLQYAQGFEPGSGQE